LTTEKYDPEDVVTGAIKVKEAGSSGYAGWL